MNHHDGTVDTKQAASLGIEATDPQLAVFMPGVRGNQQ